MPDLARWFGCAGSGDPACVSRVTRKPSGGARVTRSEFPEDPGWTGLTGVGWVQPEVFFPLRIRVLRVAALFLGSVAGQ